MIEEFATKINLIDEDHKEIISRMNDVVKAGEKGDEILIERSLSMLLDFCLVRFSNEENLLLKSRIDSQYNL
ncbi:MAG: hypothetical protein FWE02_02450 [Defluviitaleaceae bacterium]|nr:hypothetical protein [Defluviitaleaceae bacterium]